MRSKRLEGWSVLAVLAFGCSSGPGKPGPAGNDGPSSDGGVPPGGGADAAGSIEVAADVSGTGRESGSPPLDTGVDVPAADAGADAAPGPGAGQWEKLATPGIEPVHALLANGKTIFTGSASGFRPGTFGGPDVGSPGIFRSDDGGETWAPASLGLFDYGVMALASEGSDLFAAAGDLMRSRDGGRSWKSVASPGRDWFSIVAAGPGLVVAGVKDFGGPGLIRSLDGGDHFEMITTRERVSEVTAVAIRPPLVLIGHNAGLQRSTDNGANFVPVPFGSGSTFFLAFHQIVIADDKNAWAACSLGLMHTTDAGVSWQPVTFDPDTSARAHAVAVSGQEVLLGGVLGTTQPTQGFLRRSFDGGATWHSLPIKPTPQVERVAIDGGTWLAGGSGGLQRSTDTGQTWAWANGPEGPPARSRTVRVRGLVIDDTSHSLHPDGDLYALIGNELWRSTDAAASWKLLPVPASPDACAVLASGAILCGGYRSTDHGETWVEMQFLGRQRPSRFAGRGPLVYAVAAGYPWCSEDDGVSWTQRTQVESAATNLAVSRDLMVVYHGSKRSFDKGMNWQEIGQRVSFVDAEGRLYVNQGQNVSYSDDGGTKWHSLNTQLVAFYPSAIGAMAVLGDRIWLQIHNSSPARDRVVVGGHAESVMWVPAEEGLGHPLVNTFAFDRAGRLHATTNGGLYRMTPP